MTLLRKLALTIALTMGALTLPAQTQLLTWDDENNRLNGATITGFIPQRKNIEPSDIDGGEIIVGSNTPFTVTLQNPVTLSNTKGLVLYFAFWLVDTSDNTGAPTAIKVSGRLSGQTQYQDLGYAYILYRGGSRTFEFSNRVYGNGSYDSFQFEIKELSSGNQAKFYQFNLFAIGNDEPYPAGRLDPLHAITDYYLSYKDFEYHSNKGILSHHNHYGDNAIYYCTGTSGADDYTMDTPWGEDNVFYYDGERHELPTFDKQGDSQMPHITEMTLYAMPGDVITLIPFYDLPTLDNYREKFSHWYGYLPKDEKGNLRNQDYKKEYVTDNAGNSVLDFLIDPSAIVKVDNEQNFGYFAGSAFPRGIGTFVIHNMEELWEFRNLVLQGGGYEYLNAILAADIDGNGVNFAPIGDWNSSLNSTIPYRGKFNGNGHTIKNLNILLQDFNYNIGFFGSLGSGATISNLNLVDIHVVSGGRSGVLAGTAIGTVNFENCFVRGDVDIISTANNTGDNNNKSFGGGILGIATSGAQVNMTDVAFIGSISGGYGTAGSNGALVGKFENGTSAVITNCYADAIVDNIYHQNGMFNNEGNVSVVNSYMNVTNRDYTSASGLQYKVHQTGFANEYPLDENAFHIDPEIPNVHIVRVYNIPENSEQWPVVYINYWGEGLNTGWPGIQLTKGDGYYYTTIPDIGNVRMMVNNGNDNKTHDYVMGKDAGFSNENGEELSFTRTSGDYKITYNGHKEHLTIEDQSAFTTATKIYVRENLSKWDGFVLYMTNEQGQFYSKAGADESQPRPDSRYAVFNIPPDFNRKGLKYTVIPYKGNVPNSPLLSAVKNPLPAKSPATHRIFASKPDTDGWSDFRAYAWMETNRGVEFPGKNADGSVILDGKIYYYFDQPSDLGAWGGINFTNGITGKNNGELQFQDAIVYYDADMLVNISQLSTTVDNTEGILEGGYFDPIFFEYQEGKPAPTMIVNGQSKTAGIAKVGDKTYYYINFSPVHYFCSRLVVGQNQVGNRQNPTVIEHSEAVSAADVWANEGFETTAQFYSALPLDGNPTVYLDSDDFYTEVNRGLGWSSDRFGQPAPAQTTKQDVGVTHYDSPNKYSSHADLRWYGTVATFYQPRKGSLSPEQNLSLDKDVYHIAADFAHEFNPKAEFNLDDDNKIIHEPILAFRYIWHIKDGKTFADANTETSKKNLVYLNNNSRAVSARAGADFQIRLNTLVPANNFTFARTNFYYKKGENSYARVPRVGIEVRKNNELIDNQRIFFFDATTTSQGVRNYQDTQNGFGSQRTLEGMQYDNAEYQAGDGKNTQFYRSLFCKAADATEGTYTVRLYALETDGTEIKTRDGARLYLDEYVVTFLGKNEASLLTEDELKSDDYYTHRAEYLEKEDVCGSPAVVVDFDQYRTFESEPYVKSDYLRHHGSTSEKFLSYKWPMLWQKNSYSFGYGGYYNYDFNEYIIANHSSQVMYHAATLNKVGPNGEVGVFDRLFHDTYDATTREGDMGYFYYVNAASDPGVAAKLEINSLCPGSTVAVSAWLCEMSYENEVANMCFNFVAVDRDGNREIVHSFVSGYIDRINYGDQNTRYNQSQKNAWDTPMQNHGKWMHVYYSFIPDLSSVKNLTAIDHYELELENNCVSSIGADYAVDDIRAYIISPAITARQLNPVCDATQKTVGICISSRFDKLLDSNGLIESTEANGLEAETLPLHFAVLDKKKYDDAYNAALDKLDESGKLTSEQLAEIVDKAIIAMNETTNEDVEKITSTKVEISTHFPDKDNYSEDKFGEALYYTSPTSGTRYVRTNILPYDADLRPGKDYYIVLYAQYKNADGNVLSEPTLADFAVTDDPCAKYAVMTLQGSGIIKIDGIAYSDGEPVEVCVGQSPVVQVDLKMITDGKEVPTPTPVYDDYVNAPNHYYDWFNGSIEEFMLTREGGRSYYDLLYLFRNGKNDTENPENNIKGNLDAAELPDPVEGQDVYAPLRPLIESGKLVLHASSFVFPPLVDKEYGENIYVLTAMPIIPGPDDENGYKVCSQPNEIRLHVQDNAPLMMDGFAGIEYPNADVPVRAGFTQLGSVSKLGNLTKAGTNVLEIDNTITKVSEDLRVLELPLRGLQSYKGEGTAATMTMAGNRNEQADPYVYLVETNDPSYIGLDKHPMDVVAIKNSLLPVGMVADMSAKTDAADNKVTIVFDKQMEFSEGYYYRMRFTYDEVIPTEVEGYCEGHVVFTIKVVPEYTKWTGADSRNWNNDANWSRVSKDDILLPDGEDNAEKIKNFTTSAPVKKRVALIEDKDGVVKAVDKDVNANTLAYAPMDFTKVLVTRLTADDETKGYPYMFGPTSKDITTLRGSKTWDNQSAPATAIAGVDMTASKEIEFDMAAFNVENGPLAVRPWYANTCEQIHFNHGAEMAHQESFVFGTNYQKAWVEMEMAADRWYTLGSPLQGVVAGDMYTKTAGGKQDNELFTDITFNNTDYGRYEPAVYQRGWNKASAKTYMLGDNSHKSHNSAVSLNWSRVYNDVAEPYAPGLGYSIRSTYPNGDTREETEKYFRFRLPKADTFYSYFDQDDKTEDADKTTLDRGDERHALTHALTDFTNGSFTTTLTVGTEGNYFLVGNPFIARMKMNEFLEVNKDVVDQAYWIMTSVRQDATLWDEKSGTFISTDQTESVSGVIAPMQGFFVKSKNKGTSLELKFTPAMIEEGNINANLQLKSVPTFAPQLITVSALDAEGEVASRAVINIDPAATAAYDGAEDAALLLDSTLGDRATVYTVASEQALAINSLDGIVETEIGLLATEGTATTVLFEGIDEAEGLQLLDTATGTFTDMFDGMTVEVDGSASGRFYITRPASSLPELSLAVVLKDRTVSIVSSTEGIAARVYTPSGMYLGEWSVDDTVLHFDLDPGIFIVEAVADAQRTTRKFVVK